MASTPPTSTSRGTDAAPPPDDGPPISARPRSDQEPTWSRSGTLVIAVALATLAGFLLGRGTSGPADATAPTGEQSAAVTQSTSSTEALRSVAGDPGAPVTIVQYADFQCPHCARHSTETHPELVERYVDDGLVRIEWRDFPVLGPTSMQLAIAGRAAEQQGRFWEFHDAVYATEGRIDDLGRISEYAQQAGLDMDAFAADLADPMLELAVRRDLDEGRAAGVTGTPAFMVNGRPVQGAQPLDTFVQMIEQELSGEVPAAPTELAPEDAEELLSDPPEGLQVVDVRTPEEIAEGTLRPRGELIELDFYGETYAQDLLDTLDPDRPVFIYCRSGNRSGQTLEFLAAQGYGELYGLDGGVVAWQESGRELVR